MINLSLKSLNQGLLEKKFSSVELTQFFLERVQKYNTDINAFITIDEEKSLAQAKHADTLIQSVNKVY